MLVAALTNLTCQVQAWAMDDFDNTYAAASAHLPVSPEHELKDPPQKKPSIATQLRREQAKNKKLKAKKAAAQAKNKKLKAQIAAVQVQMQLEAEYLKTEQLHEQLATLQATQSALTLALTPNISQIYKDVKYEYEFKNKNRKTKRKKVINKTYSHKNDGLSLRSVLRS